MIYQITEEQRQQLLDATRGVKFCVPPAQRQMVYDSLELLQSLAPVSDEPVGVTQHLHELNDAWASKLPIGSKLYTHERD
jgi:hypothetical protein